MLFECASSSDYRSGLEELQKPQKDTACHTISIVPLPCENPASRFPMSGPYQARPDAAQDQIEADRDEDQRPEDLVADPAQVVQQEVHAGDDQDYRPEQLMAPELVHGRQCSSGGPLCFCDLNGRHDLEQPWSLLSCGFHQVGAGHRGLRRLRSHQISAGHPLQVVCGHRQQALLEPFAGRSGETRRAVGVDCKVQLTVVGVEVPPCEVVRQGRLAPTEEPVRRTGARSERSRPVQQPDQQASRCEVPRLDDRQ